LALAAALGDLTTDLRRARTVLWCCLQLGSCDLPTSCIDAARRSTELNPALRHQSPPSVSTARLLPFGCRENKLLTSETGTNNDADICNGDDDDDDVFTYAAELVDVGCENCAPDVSRQLM